MTIKNIEFFVGLIVFGYIISKKTNQMLMDECGAGVITLFSFIGC